MWQRVVEPVTRVHGRSYISSPNPLQDARVSATIYNLQDRREKEKKNFIERNRSIEVSSDTPRILSSSPRRGTAQQKEFVFYHVSNLFWIFFTTDVYTHLLSSYGNGKEQQVTKAFYNCFTNASFHIPNHHHHPRILRVGFSFGHEKTQKKVTSNPRYFLSIALFQTQTPTTRSILDSYHDFVLASRLNFQHIHYSVFPAVVSSSFHLFQIHRLIKTRTKKNHNFYGSALDIGLAQRERFLEQTQSDDGTRCRRTPRHRGSASARKSAARGSSPRYDFSAVVRSKRNQ